MVVITVSYDLIYQTFRYMLFSNENEKSYYILQSWSKVTFIDGSFQVLNYKEIELKNVLMHLLKGLKGI